MVRDGDELLLFSHASFLSLMPHEPEHSPHLACGLLGLSLEKFEDVEEMQLECLEYGGNC